MGLRPFLRKTGHYAFIVFVGVVVLVTLAHVQLGYFGETLLAQVGVVAGVAPNPYNTLNEQLDQKAAAINSEQAYLNQEQAALASSTAEANSFSSDPLQWYLTAAVAALMVLILLNFYFDWRRAKREEEEFAATRAPRPSSDVPRPPADRDAH